MGEPGGLPSMGSHRVGHDWSHLAAAAAFDPQIVTTVFYNLFPFRATWHPWRNFFPSKHRIFLNFPVPRHGIISPPWSFGSYWGPISEKAMAPHSSTLAWKIPWMEEPGRLQSMGSLRVGYDWATSLSLFTFMHWRRNGNPLQCSCLENPRDGGAWWTAVSGVAQSWTRLKSLSSSSSSSRGPIFGNLRVYMRVSSGQKACFCSWAIFGGDRTGKDTSIWVHEFKMMFFQI